MKSLKNIAGLGCLLLVGFGFFSCEKKDTPDPFVQPTVYSDLNFLENSKDQRAVLAQLKGVVSEIEKCEKIDSTTTYSKLIALYMAGGPTLSEIGTPYFDSKIKAPNAWLQKAANASGKTYNPLDSNGTGGVYGAYLFDESGLDLAELVEKTMFGSVIYKHSLDLLSGPISLKTADQLVAIYGANPTFPNTSTSKTLAPDIFLAKYAARRDKNDGTGLYTNLKLNLIKLKTAVGKGEKFNKERDEAASAIKSNLEKAMAASVINYCKTVQSNLSKTDLKDTEKASALHSLTEAIGFTLGLRGIPQDRKKISDAEIDEILSYFNYSESVKPTTYRFVLKPLIELPKLNQAITKLKSIYGFTETELNDFSKNWIVEQGR